MIGTAQGGEHQILKIKSSKNNEDNGLVEMAKCFLVESFEVNNLCKDNNWPQLQFQ